MLLIAHHITLLQRKILVKKLKRGRSEKMKSQPKHPWCKKSCNQESKKGHAEKNVKLKWAAKASCC